MRASSSRWVPVRFAFAAGDGREEGWGRFLELGPARASLMSRSRLESRDRLLCAFDLPGERFEGLPAEVLRAAKDADGYHLAELRFRDEVTILRLGRSLRALLARSAGAGARP